MSKKLYKFHWDCGRTGDVEGIFVAEPSEVDRVIGQRVYFGEILGKHSEVFGTLERENLTILETDQVFIEKFEKILPGGTGYNPLEYYERE